MWSRQIIIMSNLNYVLFMNEKLTQRFTLFITDICYIELTFDSPIFHKLSVTNLKKLLFCYNFEIKTSKTSLDDLYRTFVNSKVSKNLNQRERKIFFVKRVYQISQGGSKFALVGIVSSVSQSPLWTSYPRITLKTFRWLFTISRVRYCKISG